MGSPALQVMDVTSLRAVIADINKQILPSRFEKAQQPEPSTLQIGFRSLKGLTWLELSWGADAPRLVQIQPPSSIGSESTLAKQVQYGLRQLALVELKQKGFERVVEFRLSVRPGEPIQRTLVLELMGRHSNILLLDKQRRVITLGRQVREHQSRIRPIGTGDMYVPPPQLKGIEPSENESFERWKERICLIPIKLKKALQDSYQGISPSLALQIANEEADKASQLLDLPVQEISETTWHHLYQRWCIWLRKLEHNNFNLYFDGPTTFRVWKCESLESSSRQGLSLKLGLYYRKHLDLKNVRQKSQEIKTNVHKLKGQEEHALLEQEILLEKTFENKILQNQADELLCLQSPCKDKIKEAQKLYLKARKLRRAIPILKKRIDHHHQRLQIIQQTEVFLESLLINQWEEESEKLERLCDLQQEVEEYLSKPQQNRKNASSNKSKPPKPLQVKSPGGLIIQIGRNHRQNEFISLQKARNGDLWFHAQECPGSHVVLKASAGIAEEEDLQLAADLAAFFSRAKGNHRVPIIMVPTQQLQRIPGAIPGTVRHRGSSICWGVPSRGDQKVNPQPHSKNRSNKSS